MAGQYRLFNLIVESEIPIYETPLLDGRQPPDVTVTLGSISIDPKSHPNTVQNGSNNHWRCVPSPGHVLFNCYAATYEILDGNKIICQPQEDAPVDAVRGFLLGTAFGALQVQRGRLPLHGGAIDMGGKTLIITGRQGAGKSTVTSSIVHKGFLFLADDVSGIIMEDGIPMVFPAYPQRKLCRDACIQLGYDPEELSVVDNLRDKFAIRDQKHWQGLRLPFGWLAEIIPIEGSGPVQVHKIDGHAKMAMFMRSIYRPWIFEDMGWPPEIIKHSLQVVSKIEAFTVMRPVESQTAEEIADALVGVTAASK